MNQFPLVLAVLVSYVYLFCVQRTEAKSATNKIGKWIRYFMQLHMHACASH